MHSGSEGLVRRRQQNGLETPKATFVIDSETPAMSSPASLSSSLSMSSRDRTHEFMSAVRAFQGRHMLQQTPNLPTSKSLSTLTRGSVEFASIAKHISLDIANTAAKLEKLSLLARRQTLFDDRPVEIAELTQIIKEDMNALNRQIGQLQQIGRANALSARGKHQQSHASSVVVSLQTKLASMTADFKNVLETRTANLRERKSRENKFSQGQVTRSMPQSAIQGYHTGSVLAAMEDEERSNGDVAISMENSQLMMNDETNQYLESRAGTMQNIERTVVELGSIFSQLAHMIKEQEEIMVRIDSNVEDAALNVEAGHSELLKYFQSVSSNRWLMIKVFGVLIFFFILFVVFMA